MPAATVFHGDGGQVVMFLARRVVKTHRPFLARFTASDVPGEFESKTGIVFRPERGSEKVRVVARVITCQPRQSFPLKREAKVFDD